MEKCGKCDVPMSEESLKSLRANYGTSGPVCADCWTEDDEIMAEEDEMEIYDNMEL